MTLYAISNAKTALSRLAPASTFLKPSLWSTPEMQKLAATLANDMKDKIRPEKKTESVI
jgi:hypothetical protein